MSLILTAEHAIAAGIREAKIIGKFVASKALPFLKDVEAAEPTMEGITALVCPSLVNIERTGEALLAKAIVAIEAAEKAAAAGMVNVALDAELVADIKSLIPAIKALAPAVPPAPVPTA